MAERRENSVLFSLKELRGIEDGRVKKEREEAEARVEADRAARAAAERSVREAEERARRDEEDRLRRIEDEKESRVREDQIRLQEAERRARVEGEVRLQEQRLNLEAQSKREQKSPMKAILGVTGVLVIVAVGLGYKMYSDHQAEMAEARATASRLEAENKAQKAELESRLARITADTDAKLKAATNEADRERIRAVAAQQRLQAQNEARSSHRGSGKTEEKVAAPTGYKKVVKKDVTDDPLDGLNLK